MEITDVRIALRDEEKLVAFVTVTFDECFVVRGVKIIEGKDGLFIAMPSRRKSDGTFQDVCHPIHREMRQKLEDRILREYYLASEGVASRETPTA
jgi:stage V sporulation protein G